MVLRRLPDSVGYRTLRELHPPDINGRPKSNTAKTTAPRSEPEEHRSVAPARPDGDAARGGTPGPMAGTLIKARSSDVETQTGGAVRVRGYLRAPAPGAFDGYDALVRIYGGKDALGLALSAGLEAYISSLSAGRALAAPRGFAVQGDRIETLRMMPSASFDLAVEHLDPRGMLGPFRLGTRIFNTALERYLTEA